MAGAAALIPGLFREGADKRHIRALIQRQDLPLVFQQDHGLSCNFTSKIVTAVVVKFHAIFPALRRLEGQLQQPHTAGIQRFFRQTAFLNRLDNLPICVFGGHGQVASGLYGGRAVMSRTPIAGNQPFKAPLVPQKIRQILFVCSGVCSADLVVGRHDGPGLGILHHFFKCRQIYLPHGPLVHLTGGIHPAVLLAVSEEMFQAGTPALALDALHKSRAQFPSQ